MIAEVVVIGGGAAGMMAAITAAERGSKVCLIEQNQKLGRKLYITGKGRCNVTHHGSPQEVLEHIPRNRQFLYSAMAKTPPSFVEDFFQKQGVPLKVERGNRVFPQSDRAADVIDALVHTLNVLGVIQRRDRIQAIHCGEEGFTVVGEGASYGCRGTILATGGMSYPGTGSTGDGYGMAQALGHTIVPLRPSLISLEIDGDCCSAMQGLSLRQIVLEVSREGRSLYRQQGELLFTHFGISGPLVLQASAEVKGGIRAGDVALLDMKPALDRDILERRVLREISEQPNRTLANLLTTLLPKLMIPLVLKQAQLDPSLRANSLTRAGRGQLVDRLKGVTLSVKGTRPIGEAIVTAGGIQVKEVNPRTMASRLIPGLFFAGEILDVDGYTGGFNLQIAWATGRAAGEGVVNWIQSNQVERSDRTSDDFSV